MGHEEASGDEPFHPSELLEHVSPTGLWAMGDMWGSMCRSPQGLGVILDSVQADWHFGSYHLLLCMLVGQAYGKLRVKHEKLERKVAQGEEAIRKAREAAESSKARVEAEEAKSLSVFDPVPPRARPASHEPPVQVQRAPSTLMFCEDLYGTK